MFLRRRKQAVRSAVAVLVLALLGAGPASAGTPPAGFQDEIFALAPLPTGMDFLPDGTLLVTSLTGELTAVASDGSTRKIGDLSERVCLGGERGLYAVAVDPGFPERPFVYMTYNRKRADRGCDDHPLPVNRVSRFTLGSDLGLDLGSETVLVDGVVSPDRIHNAGDLEFGKDGHLYVTTGDGGCYAVAHACGPPNKAAQEYHHLRGKVLRITRDGGIPVDNPFIHAGTARCNTGPAPVGVTCQEIWALGFRNPFRFAHDPNVDGVRMFINDVGHGNWEEINQGHAGGNYGWSHREGPCVTGSYVDCPKPFGFTNPLLAVRHDAKPRCSSITGGAFVPSTAWPPPWGGRYIFADYVCGKLFWLRKGTSTQLRQDTLTGTWSNTGWTREDFLTGGFTPIDLKFGPVKGDSPALYYTQLVERGGSIRRIRATGAANRQPVASVKASRTNGELPLEVVFDASATTDPDGNDLTYRFDFGDGSPVVTGSAATVSHTYGTKGRYTASVTARDPAGLSDTAEVSIDAGYLPPTIQITNPETDQTFSVGETIELRAQADDPEDGPLPGSAISWTVLLRHNDHTHPFAGPQAGASMHIAGPAPEGLSAVTNSHLELHATAIDSDGLSVTALRRFHPRRVRVKFGSNLRETPMTVAGSAFTTPFEITTWAGWRVGVRTPPSHLWHRFSRWSDGVTSNVREVAPTYDAAFDARYHLKP